MSPQSVANLLHTLREAHTSLKWASELAKSLDCEYLCKHIDEASLTTETIVEFLEVWER